MPPARFSKRYSPANARSFRTSRRWQGAAGRTSKISIRIRWPARPRRRSPFRSRPKPTTALAMLRDVIDHYRKNGVPAALVDAEKRRAIAQAEFKANSIEDLGFQWSEAVAVQGLNVARRYSQRYPQGDRRRRQSRAANLRRPAARDRRIAAPKIRPPAAVAASAPAAGRQRE